MVFLKYVGVFVGVYLIVTFVTALIIGPYAGAIGFIVGIVGVIYYRGRRRIQAAEDAFVKGFTDSMIAESKRYESRSKPVSARPTTTRTQRVRQNQSSRNPSQSRRQHVSARKNTSTPESNSKPNPPMTRAQRIGMSKKESEESVVNAERTQRNAERTQILLKNDLLEFIKNMDRQAFEHAADVLGMDFLNLDSHQTALMGSETVKSLFLNAVAKKVYVDREKIILSFRKDDLRRALTLIPSGQLSETVALVNEILGVPKPPDIKEDVPEETLKQPIASEISPLCLKCGHTNPVVAQHCISCGEKLPDLICPKCNTENIAEAKFCMGCGEER